MKDTRIIEILFVIAIACGFFTSCVSTNSVGKNIKYNDSAYRQAVMENDYAVAYAMLNSVNPKKITIAQQIDKALLDYYLGVKSFNLSFIMLVEKHIEITYQMIAFLA